ncbi:MAG: hypothetical protein JXA68_02565 [Ignavibacteriales bacterium]|nr:hypothetical protein [Ignavibacteriales bacterium]
MKRINLFDSFNLLIPECILIIGILILTFLLLFKNKNEVVAKYFFIFILIVSLVFSLLNFNINKIFIISEGKVQNGFLILDNIYYLFRFTILIISIIIGINYIIKSEIKIYNLIYFIGIIFSGLVIISSLNLFLSFLALEFFFLSLVFLFFQQTDKYNHEFQKTILSGFFISAMIVLGIIIIYGMASTVNYFELKDVFQNNSINLFAYSVSVILFLGGLTYKVFLIPVQFLRYPNKTNFNSIMSILILFSTIIFFAFLFRFLTPFFSILTENNGIQLFEIFNWGKILPIILVITIGISSLFFITTKNIKIFLLLSIILNLSNSLILFTYFNISHFAISFSYFLSTIFIHLCLFIALFLCPSEDKFVDLKDLKDIFHRSKVFGSVLIFIILSLIGFPLTLGFWVKAILIKELFSSINLVILITIIINFIITTLVYFKIIHLLTTKNEEHSKLKFSIINLIVLLVLLIGVIFFSIKPNSWYEMFDGIISSIKNLFV